MPNDFPNPQALGDWRPMGYADTDWPVSRMQAVPFSGGQPLLYPTQPQQALKLYHVSR